MNKTLLRIATRQSALALWQANHIKLQLLTLHPHLKIELIGITTSGDKTLDTPLNKMGGKGLFVKELENALLAGEADIAVHSMKDVPMELPAGLIIPVICEREDPRDAFISKNYPNLASLPSNSIVGTSSLRRSCQLQAVRPDLIIQPLRGNVDTRIRQLDEGKFDAIILAAAGLLRLGLKNRISECFDSFLPAAGQGALGIECRSGDSDIMKIIAPLNHFPTFYCVSAERAMTRRLGGSCQVPIAAYATINQDQLTLQGLVGHPDGSLLLQSQSQASVHEAEKLGEHVAEDLLMKGAREILASLT